MDCRRQGDPRGAHPHVGPSHAQDAIAAGLVGVHGPARQGLRVRLGAAALLIAAWEGIRRPLVAIWQLLCRRVLGTQWPIGAYVAIGGAVALGAAVPMLKPSVSQTDVAANAPAATGRALHADDDGTPEPARTTAALAVASLPTSDVNSMSARGDQRIVATGTSVDHDHDGYFATDSRGVTVDCDDNDPQKHPGALNGDSGSGKDCGIANTETPSPGGHVESPCGGVDWDGDGVMTIANCKGITEIVDCVDTRRDVNPMAAEIAGDGIDQNCDGSDLPPAPRSDKHRDGGR